eukprot:gene5367-3826_t
MGKKDKKDPAKKEAKKARQAAKQQKTSQKRTKKELKESGEKDIESILAEYSAKEAKKMAVAVTVVPQPSRRANFSMTPLPNGEMLMFGGEFFDGETTTVYNDLFKWNVDKNEWRQIESLNTPPPRCSHQAVLYQDKVYVFGGEYGTLDQFYHYRDLWELDLKTNTWREVEATGDWPTARSGHRMVLWRNYIILFGGFYEAMRDVKWYNDLYFFSLQERRWVAVPPPRQNSAQPKPRSGHMMFLHSTDDVMYVYGGFAKEKTPGAKKEHIEHEDMWSMSLKPLVQAKGAAAATSTAALDWSKLAWQRVSKKGEYPTARCGAVAAVFKNKALIFGGVFDEEGPRHALLSSFFNDLFAFDMDRKRWYQLGLKQVKDKAKLQEERNAKKLQRKQAAAVALAAAPALKDAAIAVEETLPEAPGSSVAAAPLAAPPSAPAAPVALHKASRQAAHASATAVGGLVLRSAEDFARYFGAAVEPCARIHACAMMRGASLVIYGGVTEANDVEITLDDCWALDINKRDSWRRVLSGTMHTLESRKERADEGGGDRDEADDQEPVERAAVAAPAASRRHGGARHGGRRADLDELRDQLSLTDSERTPLAGESLRDFYARTQVYWATQVLQQWQEAQANGSAAAEEALSEKEIKRQGFALAGERYEELLPTLNQLNELEAEQQEDEDRHRGRAAGGKGKEKEAKDKSHKDKDAKKKKK